MYTNVELHTALTAMRRAEIRQEVAEAYRAQQARTVVQASGGVWAPLVRLRAALAQALVPGAVAPPVA